MKGLKRILEIAIVFFVFNSAIAQDVPNNSFETWITASQGHEDPESWSTANSTTNTFPIYKVTTEKTDDAYDGNYAAKLTSITVFTLVAPGFITLGDFDINVLTQVTSITGGIDFNLYPNKLNAYYKYSPAPGDFFRFGMWMLRDDGTSVPDTVATALFNGYDAKSEYTFLSVDVEYRNNFPPEILNIIAISSNPDEPVVGSVLFIDKIELEYTTGIIENLTDELSIFPNPTADYFTINDYFTDSKITIYDLAGKLVYSINNYRGEQILISDFSSGQYLVKISKDGINHTQKLIVN
ncbi:MAG: T9SS type A sorting domain-containing protein [Bacteroidales bacterium]|nr:T9SS type A sorting domain-containing protein [Bacteroidales bacterium]